MQDAFKQLLINIANLFKVKTMLSLGVITTMCILTIKNMISVESFMAITSAIITYYFTRKNDEKEDEK